MKEITITEEWVEGLVNKQKDIQDVIDSLKNDIDQNARLIGQSKLYGVLGYIDSIKE